MCTGRSMRRFVTLGQFSRMPMQTLVFWWGGLATANFPNPGWVVSLAESFAQHYFLALDAADQHKQVPEAWEKVFTTIRCRNTSVLEDLVFAMTAHIVHDLPLALVEVGHALKLILGDCS